MTDKLLYQGIEDLKKWLSKVKPKDYKNRGWEDSRWIMMQTILELEYRAKFMDDKIIKYRLEELMKRKLCNC